MHLPQHQTQHLTQPTSGPPSASAEPAAGRAAPPPQDLVAPFEFVALDELTDPDQRWTTWYDVEPQMRGPEPRPDWVVTSRGAVDTELGVLKTGKEADVFLLERRDPLLGDDGALMAAKRYRSTDHRTFHRAGAYTEGRRVRRSRDQRALERGSAYGRKVAAGQWAAAEWEALCTCWSLGLAVPYPVQVDGTEILMEWISHDGASAPRLAQTRPDADRARDWYEQLASFLGGLARAGYAHGDLSAYNVLAAGDRLMVIDLPQVVDLAANPRGTEFLQRDCRNVCAWFSSRGLDVDADTLFAQVVAQAF